MQGKSRYIWLYILWSSSDESDWKNFCQSSQQWNVSYLHYSRQRWAIIMKNGLCWTLHVHNSTGIAVNRIQDETMTNLSATTSSGNNAGETVRPGTTVIVNNVLTFPMMPISNIGNLLVLSAVKKNTWLRSPFILRMNCQITYELITSLLARGVSLLGMTAISVDQFLVLHYITCDITKQCLQIEPRTYPSVFSLLALPWQYQFIGKVFVTYTWLFLFWLASPCFPFAT